MSMLQMPFTLPNPHQLLSFRSSLSSFQNSNFLHSKFCDLSLRTQPLRRGTSVIRMGGGPRTYPGGVSKWQWKRMQAKKAKQLLKARLSRERQIYEMRKRAELQAAASELERPWDVVERPPNLFSVPADEQLKALADRFQRPGGFDMWTHRDGPQLLAADDQLPSARFFPKGVVHSVKPYARIDADTGEQRPLQANRHSSKAIGRPLKQKGQVGSRNFEESKGDNGQLEKKMKNGKLRRKRDKFGQPGASSASGLNDRRQRGKGQQRLGDFDSDVYDMCLQGDGSYELQAKSDQNSAAKEEIAKLRFF